MENGVLHFVDGALEGILERRGGVSAKFCQADVRVRITDSFSLKNAPPHHLILKGLELRKELAVGSKSCSAGIRKIIAHARDLDFKVAGQI